MIGAPGSDTVRKPGAAGAERPRRVLALDPGLDATGWALFDAAYSGARATLQEYRAGLIASGVIQTKPLPAVPDYLDVPGRARYLVGTLATVAEVAPGDLVVIETPAIFGPYRSRAVGKVDRGAKALAMARAMAVLWYVIGRLEGHFAARGLAVEPVPAAGAKEDHSTTVLALWPQLPKTKTGPAADHRDAVHLGLRFLIGHRL